VLLVAAGLLYLRSRGKERLAFGVALAFVAANLVEVIGKTVINRPALFASAGGGLIHIVPFDTSFPSGHEIRAVLLVACLAACCPRLRWVWFAWLVAVSVMLIIGGWHTPTDVAGGLLIATAVVLAASRRVGERHRLGHTN